jgi:hypothetical protein
MEEVKRNEEDNNPTVPKGEIGKEKNGVEEEEEM